MFECRAYCESQKVSQKHFRGKSWLGPETVNMGVDYKMLPQVGRYTCFCSKSLGLCSCEKLPDLDQDWQIPHLYWFWPGGLSLRHLDPWF